MVFFAHALETSNRGVARRSDVFPPEQRTGAARLNGSMALSGFALGCAALAYARRR
jgi:phosphotransferase system  glucose/maltose/N-acetylglucosamine-specific IIC component